MSPLSTYDMILQPLLEKRAQLESELRAVTAAIDSLRNAKNAHGVEQVSSPIAPPLDAKSGKLDADESVVFARMTQPQAVYEVLKREGRALVARKIRDVLALDNAAPSGDVLSSTRKVQVALTRRLKTHGDVVHIGWGEWGLKEWYTDDELEKFKALVNGAGARDKREHSRRTSEGIQKAVARGAYYGTRPRITPDQWNYASKLISEGESKFMNIYREVIKLTPNGEKPMAIQTLRSQMDKIQNGEPYPSRWQLYYDNHPEFKSNPLNEEGGI